MTNEEMIKADLERAVKELELDGSNTKQRVKYLLEECLEVYFKPKNCLTFENAYPKILYGKRKHRGGLKESLDTSILITEEEFKELLKDYDNNGYDYYCYDERCKQILFCGDYRLEYQWLYIQLLYSEEQLKH